MPEGLTVARVLNHATINFGRRPDGTSNLPAFQRMQLSHKFQRLPHSPARTPFYEIPYPFLMHIFISQLCIAPYSNGNQGKGNSQLRRPPMPAGQRYNVNV